MPELKKSIALLCLGLGLAGCGYDEAVNVREGDFRDGEFSGVSTPDDTGAVGEVTVRIQGNDVVSAEFHVRQADGSLKDAEYGKTNGEIISKQAYDKAQQAVAAEAEYAAALVANDDLNAVDVIAGASLNHRAFVEAVTDALGKARN
jgi:major membrane immunogen (membrane-anchored lipoprotein)